MSRRIGLSLPLEYLFGPGGAPDAALFRAAFGGPPAAFRELRGLGVESVELRQLEPGVPAGSAVRAVGQVLEAGLGATVHAWLAGCDGEETPDGAYPWLEPLAGLLAGRGDGLLVVVHAFHAAAVQGGRAVRPEELEERTVRALGRLARFLEERRLAARFALELNRSKGRIDPSVSFRGVARMWARVGRPAVGICWDWGHGFANAQAGLAQEEPGPEFLRGVVHVHAHGLGPAGGTHWPLAGGRLPLARYLDLLRGFGYTGICNLELSPRKFIAAGAEESGAVLRAAVERSIELLKSGGRP